MSERRLGPIVSGDYAISPKYKASDWKALDLSTEGSADWKRAVDIFNDRLHGRFLSPIEAVRSHADCDIQEFSGFAIVAIDCLLIETLNQFKMGVDETPSGQHGECFATFLFESRFFNAEFDTKRKGKLFYKHFRCGILHQAQTSKKSRVRFGEPSMVQLADPKNIDEGLILDRELFHDALVREIRDYAARLESPASKDDRKLRQNFVTKMNHIVK
jgi:hypothetical protein